VRMNEVGRVEFDDFASARYGALLRTAYLRG
jgi:hypothetical protein